MTRSLPGYGGGPFEVVQVTPLTTSKLKVQFSAPLDFSYAPNLTSLNYTIPSLTVIQVTQSTYNSVILDTTPFVGSNYQLTVITAKSVFESTLTGQTFNFSGVVTPVRLKVAATHPRRVRVTFDRPMPLSGFLINPSSYALTDYQNVVNPILTVTPEQQGDPTSLLLTLLNDIEDTHWYHFNVSPTLLAHSGLPLSPRDYTFQWNARTLQTEIRENLFTGEYTGGILGQHAGLLFFSPSLEVPSTNSIIQVEDVSVCNKAYDTYVMPQPVDPAPLFLWAPGISLENTQLNSSVVWGGPFRLNEISIALGQTEEDTATQAVDGRCVVTLQEEYDPTYVALLNNSHWRLFDNSSPTFICANNLGPIPPGTTTTVILVP
jgi:hypothetical protein